MKRPVPLALFLSLALGGCAVHRSQLPAAEVAMPEAYDEERREDPAQFPAPTEHWWQIFGDPTLDQLLADAFRSNLDLAQAYARLEQFLATVRITGAGERPTIGLNADAGRSHQPGLNDDSTTTDYRVSAAANYELDLWQKLSSRTRAAGFDSQAQRQAVLSLYLSLSAQIADFYYLAVEQRAQVELTDRTIASFQDALERVEHRYRAGLVPSLDVFQARQNLAGARARRPNFEAGLAASRHALAVLAGHFPDAETGGDLATLPDAPPLADTGIPSDLLQRRPDLHQAYAQLQASDARVAAAVADRLPSIQLFAAGGTSRTVLEGGTASGVFWNLLAGLTQPLFDAGRRKAEVERNEARFREAAAQYREAVLQAFREVEDALSANRTTEERIRRLEELVAASAEGLRAANDRYLQGLSDYLPVLDAQVRSFESSSALLAARRQLISDRIGLVRALGGDWMGQELAERASPPGKDEMP